ncbi:MAG: VTT domain-containing protein [Treponema sp.]|nr:VTT domain-containing protein [Treponema sp.]
MTFPGLRKLAGEFGFANNGTYFYGFIHNTYVIMADGKNKKIVQMIFPCKIEQSDKEKILSWKKKGYAKSIDFDEGDAFEAQIVFAEYFLPFKIEKIKEVVQDIANYIKEKYPEEKPKCTGKDCQADSELEIYNIDGIPLPLCPFCAKKIESDIERAYEEESLKPNNYIQGLLGALTFPIPGIFLTYIFFMLGRIAAVSGIVYFFLAQKGYTWAKGKLDKIGILIISLSSIFYTIAGTFVSYVACIVKEILKDPSVKGVPLTEIIKYTVSTVLKEEEARAEIIKNCTISLILCGIVIAINTARLFKSSAKTKLEKA